jgi:hypothetical protein
MYVIIQISTCFTFPFLLSLFFFSLVVAVMVVDYDSGGLMFLFLSYCHEFVLAVSLMSFGFFLEIQSRMTSSRTKSSFTLRAKSPRSGFSLTDTNFRPWRSTLEISLLTLSVDVSSHCNN